MIRLITGTPGAGKTLRAMFHVLEHKKRAEKEGLPYRCCGNVDGVDPELMAPLEGEWYDQDKHTLVVIDEAQTVFRPTGPGNKQDKRVTELEVHRHKGIDLILVTQHPMLINHHVRRLVGKHEHVTRKNNFGLVSIHSKSRALDPDDRGDLYDADTEVWRHPKELFDTYKSAEVHTEVKGWPKSVKVGGGILAGGGALLFLVLNIFSTSFAGQFEQKEKPEQTQQTETESPTVAPQNPPEPNKVLAVGGMWKDNKCRLVDENGLVIDLPYNDCMNAVEKGLPTHVRPAKT